MKKVEFEIIVIIGIITLFAVLIFYLVYFKNDNKHQTIQPEIIQELQEDSKFVKITIDIIKETEVIENE